MDIAATQGALKPILGPSTQLGFVVRDLDAALRHWIDGLGVGPFLVLDKGTGRPPSPSRFRGHEVVVETRLAFGFLGETQIELIEQVNDAPSPYREFIGAGREGLQHLGYVVPDYGAARRRIEAAGYVSEFEIPIAGQADPIAYFRAPSLLGLMLEIVPPRWRRAREAVSHHLAGWKGSEAVSRFPTYGDFLAHEQVIFD